jgi:hypothetical protein
MPPRNPQFRVDVDDVNASDYRVPQIVIIGARSTVQTEWELHSKLDLRNSLDI